MQESQWAISEQAALADAASASTSGRVYKIITGKERKIV